VTERNDMEALAKYAGKLLRVFNSLKARYAIEFDEILIVFALGRLNFDQGQGKPIFVKPANIVSLSEFLAIPRETLRRKLLRLEEKDLVQRTSYGFVVKDMNVWRRLGELIQQPAEADA
jgi:DNA-binding MarR family transcriptional regulator